MEYTKQELTAFIMHYVDIPESPASGLALLVSDLMYKAPVTYKLTPKNAIAFVRHLVDTRNAQLTKPFGTRMTPNQLLMDSAEAILKPLYVDEYHLILYLLDVKTWTK